MLLEADLKSTYDDVNSLAPSGTSACLLCRHILFPIHQFPSVWLLLTLYRLTVSLRPATNSTSGFPQPGVSFCLRGVDSAISVEWETQSESTVVAGEVTFTSICFDVGWKLCMSKTILQEIETVSCWVSIWNTYSIFSSVSHSAVPWTCIVDPQLPIKSVTVNQASSQSMTMDC